MMSENVHIIEKKVYIAMFANILIIPSPAGPPPPPLGVMSSLLSLARRALSRPKWWAVALFFCVLAIYNNIKSMQFSNCLGPTAV